MERLSDPREISPARVPAVQPWQVAFYKQDMASHTDAQLVVQCADDKMCSLVDFADATDLAIMQATSSLVTERGLRDQVEAEIERRRAMDAQPRAEISAEDERDFPF